MQSKAWKASPVLGVRQVREAAEYYRDVLGFRLDPIDGVFQPSPDEPGGVYAIVTRSGVQIHFQIRRGESPQAQRPAFERDVYLYVDDVDGLYADLQRRGARIRSAPQMAPHGIREMVVEDLNGYRLAFGDLGRSMPRSGASSALLLANGIIVVAADVRPHSMSALAAERQTVRHRRIN